MINPGRVRDPTMIFSIFKDVGPEIEFNNSGISGDEALMLVMSGFTLVEMNKDSKGRVDGSKNPRMLGPIPVPDTEDLKAVAIPFETEIIESSDERIAQAGYRDCVVFFIFEGSAIREVLDSYGLINPYFARIARTLAKESDITQTNLKNLYDKMVDMFSGRIPRIFGVKEDNSLKEMVGKRIDYADAYLVCDFERKSMYVLMYNPEMDVWRKREIEKASSELNSNLFRNALRREFITDMSEIGRILDLHNVKITPI